MHTNSSLAQGQAAIRGASQVSPSAAERRETMSNVLLESLKIENNKLQDVIIRLINFSDKMFGPTPKDPATCDKSEPHCIAQALSCEIDTHRLMMSQLSDLVNRIEQIA